MKEKTPKMRITQPRLLSRLGVSPPPPPPGGETTNKTNFIELLSGDGEKSNYEKDYVVTDLKKRDSTKLNARFFKQFISRGQSV